MAEQNHGDDGLEMLHRMIAYVREEAVRLRIMDVAMLLEHAEMAVTAFAPGTPADPSHGRADPLERRVEH